MAATIEQALTGPVKVLNRMRLSCSLTDKHGQPRNVKGGKDGTYLIHPGVAIGLKETGMTWQVMNEITLHRGREPHLTVVDAYFDDQHLTEAVVCAPRQR